MQPLKPGNDNTYAITQRKDIQNQKLLHIYNNI